MAIIAILLAGGVIILTVVLIVLLIARRLVPQDAPAQDEPDDDEEVLLEIEEQGNDVRDVINEGNLVQRHNIMHEFEDNAGRNEDVVDNRMGKTGTKKVKKFEKKQAKKQAHEALMEHQRIKREREARQEEIRAQREAERELEREAGLKLKSEQLEEKYVELSADIKLESEGFDGVMDEETIEKFISYVSEHKVIILDKLASEFRIKTQAVVERIERMIELKKINGVFDERGKFIQVTEEELHSLAQYIRNRGRASLTDIANVSNEIIVIKE